MRPQGTPQQLEKRRRQAIQLLARGENMSAVALKLGASKSSVCRWFQEYQENGLDGLRPNPIPGRPSQLSASQKGSLAKVLLKGPTAYGYRTDLWTLKRIADVIEDRFDIDYHPNHVWRILLGMGWSCQKPERRALQRNEEEIEKWKKKRWPHIKKRRRHWRPPRFPR